MLVTDKFTAEKLLEPERFEPIVDAGENKMSRFSGKTIVVTGASRGTAPRPRDASPAKGRPSSSRLTSKPLKRLRPT